MSTTPTKPCACSRTQVPRVARFIQIMGGKVLLSFPWPEGMSLEEGQLLESAVCRAVDRVLHDFQKALPKP